MILTLTDFMLNPDLIDLQTQHIFINQHKTFFNTKKVTDSLCSQVTLQRPICPLLFVGLKLIQEQ